MKHLVILLSLIACFSTVAEAEWIYDNELNRYREKPPYYNYNHLSYRYVGQKTDELMVVDLRDEIGQESPYYNYNKDKVLEIPSYIMVDGVSTKVVGLFSDCFIDTTCGKIILPSTIRFINKAFMGTIFYEIEIPEGPSHIGNYVFSACHNLRTVTFPNSLTTIGTGCFYKCGLESITFGKGLVSIGDSNFNNCNNLEEVILPDGLQEFGKGNFKNCANLKRVVIPKYLRFEDCFNECPEIEEIVVGNHYPRGIYNNFNKVDKSKCRLVVPAGSEERYKTSYGWKDFTNIVSDATVGIEIVPQPEVGNEIEDTELYFDVSGMPISDPSAVKGIVIKKRGTKAEKIIVK